MKKTLLVFLLLFFPCWAMAYTEGKPITIVYNKGIAPIKFTDSDGLPSGILNEYWKLLEEQSGLKFEFREVETFGESLDLVKSGEVDLHAGIFFTEERNTFLEYSEPIFDVKYHIYSSADLEPPKSLKDTRGVMVGVVQGGYTKNYITNSIPSSQLVVFKDFETLFNAVLQGELKVFISSDIHLNYYLSVNNLDNPFRHSQKVLYEQTYFGATAKKNRSLISRVKEGQIRISDRDRQRLKERWLHFKVDDVISPGLTTLTKEEIRWIQEHPVLRVTNEMDWPPFDFNKNGQPKGLSIDLLQKIAGRIGIKLDFIHGYSWNELLEMIRKREIDVIHSLNRSKSREQFILFTDPYISNQTVIVTAKGNSSITDSSHLENKKIAVIEGYNQMNVLKEKFENVQFVPVGSPLEALKAVSSGNADATIRFNGVASYLIDHHLFTNLKFVNEFDVEGDNLHELFLGVRKDWPILQSILQKGLDSITLEEMNALKKKWVHFNTQQLGSRQITLTDEERQWIAKNPEISLGSDYKWPPFDFADEEGKHTGLSAEYVKIIEERTGLRIKIQVGVWSDIISMMKQGKLDGLVCAVKTDGREQYLDFSSPYLSVPTVIITTNDNHDVQGLADLRDRTVSINKNSYMHDWLQSRYPDLKLHLSTSNEASLEAVSYGEADAYIGNLAVANYIIRKRLLTNLRVVKKLDQMITKPSIAVDKSHHILLGIIQKVLQSMTDQEHQLIRDKWYLASIGEKVNLTEKERKWIKEHPVIRLAGDPAWAPVSYRNGKDRYVGIVPDYFKIIEEKSDLRFEVVKTDNWSSTLEAFKDDRLDIIDAISESPERRKLMDFTDVYMNADVVLITRDDSNYIKGLNFIGNRKVGTVKDYITESHIRADFPKMNLQLYGSASEGLRALSNGEVDVFVIDIPTFEYYSKESSLTNLKISGLTAYSFTLAIGVRKGQPELVSILNKVLGHISLKEKNEVYNNWVSYTKPLIDYSLLWKFALAACIFFGALGYWNRRLAHEVSLRKVAEEKALQASKAKSDFLANMSHEIRTPMNSVLGFAELLDNMITDQEQKSYLKSIRTGGKALLGIINDILDLSKIEAGMMTLKSEPVSLLKLFEEMHDFFLTRMVQKKLSFTFHLEERFPEYLLMDGTRLRQILVNLLGNALKFTNQGEVALACGKLRIDPDSRFVDFDITVSDTGIGIPAEQLQRIFNKFEQRAGQDASSYGGTGLGLSICENLVQMMGGTIEVESVEGKGATFILHFSNVPIALEIRPKADQELLLPSGFKAAKVLVVDDVDDNRSLLIGHFRGSEVRFQEAPNGKEALDLLYQSPIDLVFLDLRMPIMNGYETITAIRQDEQLQHIPVVAVTASVMGEDLEKVEQYGFDGYLRKPITQQDILREAVNHLSYENVEQIDEVEKTLDLSDFSMAQLHDIIVKLEQDLLPEWQVVKDSGDFELIGQFVGRLDDFSLEYKIPFMTEYTERLRQNIASYEIAEVANLMETYPEQIKVLKSVVKKGNLA